MFPFLRPNGKRKYRRENGPLLQFYTSPLSVLNFTNQGQ